MLLLTHFSITFFHKKIVKLFVLSSLLMICLYSLLIRDVWDVLFSLIYSLVIHHSDC